jgi:hypothetical protein
MIASGLPETTDHERKPKIDKSDGEIGSGKQVNVPDRAQKNKPKWP